MGRPGDPNLSIINMRLRKQDIATAREQAKKLGIYYQQIIRMWVAEAAEQARRLEKIHANQNT